MGVAVLSPRGRDPWRPAACLTVLLVALGAPSPRAQQPSAPIPSSNVNVISGTGIDGDWTLQRQNEPSGACSSRNPLNCMVGANDYRSVDIPFPQDANRVIGDAWLGWYTTKDGGQTWRTRLLPGFPQDASPQGLVSPLKGMDAGADPVVRSGANGLFFYAGIVFTRGPGGGSRVFVARFIDNNDRERSDVDSIQYIDTTVVQAAPQGAVSNYFIDKPWLAVDVPRDGARRCRVGGRKTGVERVTLPCSRVYLAYTVFGGEEPNQRATIMVARSEDSGATWSAPQPLRIDADVNDDGVVTAADQAAVRSGSGQRCQVAGYNPALDVNVDCVVNSRDTSIVGKLVGATMADTLPKIHQGATLAIAPSTGAVHLAWRQFRHLTDPDAIYAARSADGGVTFSPPVRVSTLNPFDQGTSLTSFRSNAFPSLTADASGRAYLSWTTRGLAPMNPDPVNGDTRVVVTTSGDGLAWLNPQPVDNHEAPGHQFMPSLVFTAGRLQLLYYDQREDLSGLHSQYVDELPIVTGPSPKVRHTTEVRVATATPGASPAFESVRVSDYVFGLLPGSSVLTQLQFDPPNLPIFRQGTTPFMGDYIEIFPAQPMIPTAGGATFNTAPAASPLFHAVWADNRDVRPPPDGDWTRYTPPNPPFTRPTTSGFDPTQQVPECTPGFVATRNQNIYTARVTGGLVAAALTNFKQLGTIQRSFPIYVQNTTRVRRSYRLSVRTQPVGGTASLRQFEQLTTLDVSVPAISTVARTVYVSSTDPRASVPIDVIEITEPGGAPVTGGQAGEIVLNPDPSNPDLDNSATPNPDVDNPDVDNPDVDNVEVYNPDVDNAAVLGLANPDVENPDVDNPDVDNTLVLNPSVVTADPSTPDVDNPDVDNPDVDNPDVDNLDLINGGLTDTTWTMTNRGNTAASYSLKLLLRRALPVGFRSQLLVHRVYQTPTVQGCDLKQQTQNVLLVNLPDPSFAASSAIANPDVDNPDVDNVTVAIPPGDSITVTLRVYDPDRSDAIVFDAAAAVTPAMVAQAVETEAVAQGETIPEAAAPLLPEATPPAAPAGEAYSFTLQSTGTGTWTVVGGALPAGLTLNPTTGEISGVATTGGTFTALILFVSSDGLEDHQNVTITVAGAGTFADLAVSTIASPDPGTVAALLTYTTTAQNNGPGVATNLVLTQSLPIGLTSLTVTPPPGMTCEVTTFVQCTLASLGAGASAALTITLTPGAAGFAASTANVESDTGDAVVANNGVTVSTLIQGFAPCPTPTLTSPKTFEMTPTGSNFGLHVHDVNRDGHLDAVSAHPGPGTISVLLGDGTGNFGPAALITGLPSVSDLAIADYNEDGNFDIAAGTTVNAATHVNLLLGDGTGAFAAPIQVPAIRSFDVVPGDFNNDGNVDLVAGASNVQVGSGNGQMAFLLGHGDGTFDLPVITTVGTGVVRLEAADYNLDGKLDLATTGDGIGPPGGGVQLRLGDGTGGFAASPSPAGAVFVGAGARIRRGLGDVNLDGNPDLAITTGAGGTADAETHILFGDGAGGFSLPLDLNSGPFSQFTSAADLTGDGLPDVVTVHPIAGSLGVQIGAGTVPNVTFGSPITFAVGESVHLRLVDVNHDNRPDVLTVSTDSPSSLSVLLNNCGAPATDLALTASDSPDPVAPNAVVTYSIEVTNNGLNPATDVVVIAASDANGLSLVSVTPSVGSCSVGSSGLTCQLGDLAVDATATVTIALSSVAGGTTFPVSASVAANEADPDTTNNGTTLTTTVSVMPLTFTVTNTSDDGDTGSLRRAIDDANLNAGPDTIEFDIPGAGPHTIQPLSPMLGINGSLTIDGTTQPGYGGAPIIELSGASAGGPTVHGLQIFAGTFTVRGLAINRFTGSGVFLQGADGGHVIQGNYIGTNVAGTAAAGNAVGVNILSPNTTVGGAGAARNVISGNNADGIRVTAQVLAGSMVGTTGAGSVILGNYIGTNAAGTAAIASVAGANGISIRVPNVTIGAPGAGNVISGNGTTGSGSGVQAISTTVTGTTTILTVPTGLVLQSNLIGTNATGTSAIPNNQGISINAGSGRIGGTSAGEGNVISGNTGNGVFLTFQTVNIGGTNTLVTQSSNVIVEGNTIGLDVSGATALANATTTGNGVSIVTSNHTIGGTTTAARNVISGNGTGTGGSGIQVSGNPTFGIVASNNTMLGNFIGLNAAGTAVVGNGAYGINITGNGNTVGGVAAGAGNVLSGSGLSGVGLNGGTGNIVRGNRIGTNPSGTAAMGNATHGVFINNSSNNVIGGDTAAARNLLSGNGVNIINGGQGVVVNTGTGNQILGNYIGTDHTGTAAIPNTGSGIGVFSGAVGTIVGGINPGQGNLISGNGVSPNTAHGVSIATGSSGTIVRGNLIGTNVAGTAALPNRTNGLNINSLNNIIGGDTTAARNVISGNGAAGVNGNGVFIGLEANGTQILGNYIGTDVTGTIAVPNTSNGVNLSATTGVPPTGTLIGGVNPGEGNVISGNLGSGINLGTNAVSSSVRGNLIGTNAAGTSALPNTFGGVQVSSSNNNVIGGAGSARNLISGNGTAATFAPGINVSGTSTANQILGNYIGVDANGVNVLANSAAGIVIQGTVTATQIGGTNPGEGNVISGNGLGTWFAPGISLSGGTSTTVRGNLIGTNAAGTAAIPNRNEGINVGVSSNNVIGGPTAAARNLISGNGLISGRSGVWLEDGATGNQVIGNYIGTDITGTLAIGNGFAGVRINGVNNTVGGASGAGNLLSGNAYGVYIGSATATGNQVLGNRIGTDASGAAALPNTSHGINIESLANNTTVGGAAAGEGNIVAFNLGGGVVLAGANEGDGHQFSRNSIFDNGALGIDLGGAGVDPNDPDDVDVGENDNQNSPVITSATSNGTQTTIVGSLDSTPNTSFTLEFFSNTACDASTRGEGRTFIGALVVTTNASGDAVINTVFPVGTTGQFITGTATNPGNSTSEFSNCLAVTPIG